MLSLHHTIQERCEIIHMLVDNAVTMQFFKKLLCTRYFYLLNRTKLERGERSLRLRDEVDMPYLPLAKHNHPIRRIASDRRRDSEPARQLRIDQHLVPAVKILGKFPLHIAVREHIVLNRLLRLVCLAVEALLRRKDARIVAALDRIVLDVIDDTRRFLLEITLSIRYPPS